MVRGRACRRHFILTGFPQNVKGTLLKQITDLGGQCSETEIFLLSCTHVLCNKPSRSEKYLGGLATGKWMLTADYVYDSHARGSWLPEENYEWDQSKIPLVDTPQLRLYIGTAAKWRRQMTQFNQGAFIGWRTVVLVENVQKRKVYQRLLRFGHAVVVAVSFPVQDLPVLAQQLTHVFVDDKHLEMVIPLAQAGVLCLKPLYIGAFLLLDPPPNPEGYSAIQAASVDLDYSVMPSQPTPRKSQAAAMMPSTPQRSNSVTLTPHKMVPSSPAVPVRRASSANAVVRGQKRRHGNVLASSKEGLRQTALDQWLTGSPSSRLNGNPSGRHHEGIPPRHIQDSPLSSSRPQTGRGEVQQGFRAGQTATAVVIDLTEDQPRQKTPVNSSRCKQGHEDVVDLTQTSDGGIGPVVVLKSSPALPKPPPSQCSGTPKTTPTKLSASQSATTPRKSPRIQAIAIKSSPEFKQSPCRTPTTNSYICDAGSRDMASMETTMSLVTSPGVDGSTSTALVSRVSSFSSSSVAIPAVVPDPWFMPSSGSSNEQSQSQEWKSGFTPPPKRFKIKEPQTKTTKLVPATCKRAQQVCLPISERNAAVFEACLEEKRLWFALDVLLMSVSSSRYHSSEVLHSVITRVLLPSESAVLSQRAYRVLWRSLRLHPPTTPALQATYFQALVTLNSDHWVFVHELLSIACDLDCSPQTRINHLLVLQFIVELLQADCRHLASHGSRQKSPQSLVQQLWWPRGQAGCVNTYVQQLFTSLTEASQLSEEETSFPRADLLEVLYDMVAMVANVAYKSNTRRSLSIPHQARVMARDLAYYIKGLEHSPGSVEAAVSRLSPAWLQMTVSQTLLDLYDDRLSTTGEKDASLTLQSIFGRYFLLLPPLGPSVACNKSGSDPTPPTTPHKTPKPVKHKAAAGPPSICANKLDAAMKRKIAAANRRNPRGESPLHVACIKNNIAKLKELLTLPGLKVNIQDHMGWTPLHEAANHGHIECVQLLLAYKPPQNIASYFSSNNNKPGVESAGVDVTLGNVHGITALHDAVENNHMAVVQLLLQHGGCRLLKQKTNEGLTVMDIARSPQMKKLLSGPMSGTLQLKSNAAVSEMSDTSGNINSADPPTPAAYRAILNEKRAIPDECNKYLRLLLMLLKSFIRVHGNQSLANHNKAVSQHVTHLHTHIQHIVVKESDASCKTLLLAFTCLAESVAS